MVLFSKKVFKQTCSHMKKWFTKTFPTKKTLSCQYAEHVFVSKKPSTKTSPSRKKVFLTVSWKRAQSQKHVRFSKTCSNKRAHTRENDLFSNKLFIKRVHTRTKVAFHKSFSISSPLLSKTIFYHFLRHTVFFYICLQCFCIFSIFVWGIIG